MKLQKMNEDLRKKLLQMSAKDLRVREELARTGELFDGYSAKMEAVHLENAVTLERIIDEHGWTGKSLVGADGAEAAWLIAQHAISLPEFSRKCLKLLETAVSEGEAEAWQAAFLQDRIAFFEGKPQKYGTQSDWNADGKMQIWTLSDAEKVNEFRAEIGLQTLEKLVWETDEPAPQNFEERRRKGDDWLKKTGWRKF
jgi:hypothetical protein